MKRYLLITLIACLPLSGFSQSLFDKFEDMDEVSSVVVNKSMFNLLAKMDVEVSDPEAKDFLDIVTKLKSLKVFTTEDADIASQMQSSVSSYLQSANMEELMRVKDKEANVKFYIKQGRDEDHVSELLMLVTNLDQVKVEGKNLETVLLSLTGDIDLNKIGSLTKKMNLPEELNKAGEKH